MDETIKNRDVEEVMRAEQARGTKRPPRNFEAAEERAERMDQVKRLLLAKDRRTYLRMLTEDYGLQVGSEKYRAASQAWDEYWRLRRS